ncbi:MAG TPA: retropepsin-like aspartic protease [Terriglobia bacterium]|nr:retropepsin-like aspartic protease [Terriglobia bacterium]
MGPTVQVRTAPVQIQKYSNPAGTVSVCAGYIASQLNLFETPQWPYLHRMIFNIIIAAMLTQFTFSFSLVRDSLVVVPVFLNGHGAYRFLLDTGATHSILSSEVADQLKIPAGRSQTLITAAGTVPVTIRTIEAVQIGGVRITDTQIAVADFDLLRTLRVDGIIGADYLKQFKISIDYAHQTLAIGR